MTHSASGSDGWLVADRRPGLVVAIAHPPTTFDHTPNEQLQLMWSQLDDCGLGAINVAPSVPLVAINVVSK